jgi:hypothetical protein
LFNQEQIAHKRNEDLSWFTSTIFSSFVRNTFRSISYWGCITQKPYKYTSNALLTIALYKKYNQILHKVNYYTEKSRIFNNALTLQDFLWYLSLGSVSYSNAKSDKTEWTRNISRVNKQTASWLRRNHNYYCNKHYYWYIINTKAFVTPENI